MTELIYFPGSYTFAKTLEYKAKQGLQSGKEVTVVPPAEYRDRFVSALEGYFIACPGQLFFRVDQSFGAHDVPQINGPNHSTK